MRDRQKTKMKTWALVLSIPLLSLVTAVDNARSQACCASTGSSDFSVVGRKDFAVIAAMVQYEPMLGHYNRNGEYVPLDRSKVRDLVFTAGFGLRPLRVFRQWQFNAVVPLRYQYRWYDGIPPSGKFGFGDASLSTRFTVLEDRLTGLQRNDSASFLPFLDLIIGVKTPTGRSPEDSVEPSGSDAMGDGSWAITAGLALQKYITRKNSLLLGFDYEIRLPHDVSGAGADEGNAKFDPGNATNYRASWQYLPDLTWSASLFTSLRVTYPSKMDDTEVQNSQILRWRMGISLTWMFAYPKWEATVAAMTDPWWHGGGWNVTSAGPSVMLQVRRNFPTGGGGSGSLSAQKAIEETEAPMAFDQPPPIGTQATCPVMKEQFIVGEHTERSEHNGKHYVYCCPGCKAQFDASPESYLD